ncbi:hypothetical protein ACLOJK_002862 [Asimina triloba]
MSGGGSDSFATEPKIDERWLVDPKLLYLGPKIGEGGHAKVYEGILLFESRNSGGVDCFMCFSRPVTGECAFGPFRIIHVYECGRYTETLLKNLHALQSRSIFEYKASSVAVKIVQPGSSPEEYARRREKFLREVVMLTRVQHENLVTLSNGIFQIVKHPQLAHLRCDLDLSLSS